ncbi:hypothetical protein BLJ79_04180 [Arthrobacter sp. UCD-GKA]|uniref:hypothetical protein n=1 Tax=Arthrobacter sp. UCD-GKA TaxID=1913576 RepID=UPI0008DE3726|nr:hypothetical protein [Arthrobacter sp. UCD-GKA]OIH85999.1 hypothetical protein BLJ79_04180 [Arthrobacter sp. UCD-GKA]
MTTDPRIEAAAIALYGDVNKSHANEKGWDEVLPRWQESYRGNARVALAAADKAATITADDLKHDENFDPMKQFPMGTIVESKDGSVWYWSEDDEWETLNLPGSKSLRGPARVIHWGQA